MTVGLFGKAVEAATLILLVTVVPRALGPADYGRFATALSLVTIGSVSLALSGPAVMARFVASEAPPRRAALARALTLRALRWRVPALACLSALALGTSLADPGLVAPAEVAFVVAALGVDAAATLTFQVALALGRLGLWSFRYPIQNGVLVVATPALYAAGGLRGALAAVVLAPGLALAIGLAAVWRPLGTSSDKARIPSAVARFVLLQGAANVLVQFQHRGPVIAAALLASATETGYAALAVGVALAAAYAAWQLFVVTLPRFAVLAEADPEAADVEVARLARVATLASLPVTIAAVALVHPLLASMLGGRFTEAESAVGVALAILPLGPITGAVGAVAALHLRPDLRLVATGAGAVAFLVTALALVPSLGSRGAAASLLAGMTVSAIAGSALFPRVLARSLPGLAIAGSSLALAVAIEST